MKDFAEGAGVAPDGLTPRAAEFLRRHAKWRAVRHDPIEDDRDAVIAADQYGLSVHTVRSMVAHLQNRFGGLQYRSASWSFEEIIGFAPVLDLDEEDPEPMVSLIEHTVAHPYGVWATLDGAVHFLYPNDDGGEYVHVFDRVEAIIESDALMAECAGWIEVDGGGSHTIGRLESRAAHLSRIDEASGHTESRWQGDGFRVHLWRTFAKVFGNDGSRWAVWAEDEAAAERARAFLTT